MNITFLGTGSAFCKKNFTSNILFEINDKRLLIDAGRDIIQSLDKVGLSYKDINSAYVSHLHGDHSFGFEYLAFCSYFDPYKNKINLYGNYQVLENLWEMLKWSLRSIQGKRLTFNDYFNLLPISDNGQFIWKDNIFELVQTVHIMDGYSIVDTYGLMITIPILNKKLYITTDTQFNPNQIKDFYNQADIIIQDCETLYDKHGIAIMSGVHAHYEELKTLPDTTKRKMYLTHYGDNIAKDILNKQIMATNDGFHGFLEQSTTYKINDFMNS